MFVAPLLVVAFAQSLFSCPLLQVVIAQFDSTKVEAEWQFRAMATQVLPTFSLA